jgi:hypothetical protein
MVVVLEAKRWIQGERVMSIANALHENQSGEARAFAYDGVYLKA